MTQSCPNCKWRGFSFKQMFAANSQSGLVCPSCQSVLETPVLPRRIAGLIPFIPFFAFLVWKFLAHPMDAPERYAFEGSLFLMMLLAVACIYYQLMLAPLRLHRVK